MNERLDFRFSLPPRPVGPIVELSNAEAEKMLLKRLEEAKADPNEALWNLAQFYKLSRQHEKALERLRQLMERLPNPEKKAECILTMGQAMEQVGDYRSKFTIEPLEPGISSTTTWDSRSTLLAGSRKASFTAARRASSIPHARTPIRTSASRWQARANTRKQRDASLLPLRPTPLTAGPFGCSRSC